MKKVICLLVLLSFLSCSTNQCINDYLDIEKKNNENSYGVLVSQKTPNSETLRIYGVRMPRDIVPKYFSLLDYNFLKQKHKNDTIVEFWNKNELKNFNYISSTWNDYFLFIEKLEKSEIKSQKYFFNISKPLFLVNRKIVMFYLSKIGLNREHIDDFVVIMKKNKGKYILLEKIYNQDLY